MDFKCEHIQWQTLLAWNDWNQFMVTSEVRCQVWFLLSWVTTLVAESSILKTTKNELQTTNTAHIPVTKFGGSIFPFSIRLSSQIPVKLSFRAKNITEWFGKLLKPCQKCIFQKLNISNRVLQIFCPNIK